MEGDHESSLRGQAEIWKYMFSFIDSMALKCAVELRIADIIHSHGRPITLSQIASDIPDTSSPNTPRLAHVMTLLTRRKIFSSHGFGEETLYGLTPSSRWLLHGDTSTCQESLAPLLLLNHHPWLMAPWQYLSTWVKCGGSAFEHAHGKKLFDFASENDEFNGLFNAAMESMAGITMRAVMAGYRDRFASVGTLVDVGGGVGKSVAEIVKLHPHIEAVNFDLPHVVAAAPVWPGVRNVAGDMFESIPRADAIFIKWIMHNWSDEDCVKILKNCRKVIPENCGKIIIVDVVLELEGSNNRVFDDTALAFDFMMAVNFSGAKERTENQWRNILKQGGFPRYKIIKIPALQSIIEAYPV